ncbi:complex I NDUFA9 subunit family protein [Novacetimonas hansenii]|uniref:3-beta-hydroxy-Delta(5)-steroid dehydrogenase n=2 Tax=Novacetimonas hansenii TaxID=436 RepID=A0ABQ0SG24_NOVHA|nr:complex I NDUFA9 subunit family protein [Novacetimonas hansenii]EFG85150.1 NADH dehydrogenase (ubiquinone) [Novacetimonas hansenii ATCC 23769]GAN85336.1 NADH dehydrogenase [Novacetimonas hansenii JCM 7643]GBQ57115.1 NADH-ubiquinone oxidoreductase 39 kDa subunit [Novacetimonas hansenii NRIC 0243]GEC64282.1 3-beta-hydroxy-Delta(5)-steroid dehydrogenase [Novacetimonas hansenii]
MDIRKVATVFGGTGFVGRYVVARLARDGYVVRVASRRPDRAAGMRLFGDVGQVVPLYASVLEERSSVAAIEGSDLVVNLVGILAPGRHAGFTAVHVDAAARVARLCASAGVGALVHMSAIGADPDGISDYGRSKGRGEVEVQRHMAEAVIVRPSIIFGAEDHFTNMFAAMARYLPVMPVYGGMTRFQPVHVADVAEAIRRIARGLGRGAGVVEGSSAEDIFAGSIFELGGPRVWRMQDMVRWIMRAAGHPRRVFAVPPWLARIQASCLEHLPGRMLTRDQLSMLYVDNVVAPGMRGLAHLGISPLSLEIAVPQYLARFRSA